MLKAWTQHRAQLVTTSIWDIKIQMFYKVDEISHYLCLIQEKQNTMTIECSLTSSSTSMREFLQETETSQDVDVEVQVQTYLNSEVNFSRSFLVLIVDHWLNSNIKAEKRFNNTAKTRFPSSLKNQSIRRNENFK